MTAMITDYEIQLAAIDKRISELEQRLKLPLQSMQREMLKKRILFLEENRCNLIYGIKRMKREEKRECST